MARRRRTDALDVLCYEWGRQRQKVMGINRNFHPGEYLGRLTCTLNRVKMLHDGAAGPGAPQQHFPEVYYGEALLVNRAYHHMAYDLRPVFDAHYVVTGVPVSLKADFLALSVPSYFTRLNQARRFVEGFLAYETNISRSL